MEKKSLFHSITADIEVNKRQLEELLKPFHDLEQTIIKKRGYILWLESQRDQLGSVENEAVKSEARLQDEELSESELLVLSIIEDGGDAGLMAKEVHQKGILKYRESAPALNTVEKAMNKLVESCVIFQTNKPKNRNRRFAVTKKTPVEALGWEVVN